MNTQFVQNSKNNRLGIKCNIALFDLDNTLIENDSDYLFGEFLCQKKLVDAQQYKKTNESFFNDYQTGMLNADSYLQFILGSLKSIDMNILIQARAEFVEKWITPLISKKMFDKLKWHKNQNHLVIIITSTHEFITRPIADLFEVDYLIATKPEILNGQFTGQYIKPACFQRDKIKLFEAFIKSTDYRIETIYAYSDSINDLPLLQYADIPTAVNPDEKLKKIAMMNNWQIIEKI